MSTFGERFKIVLLERKIKGKQIADLTNRTPQNISDYLNGRSEPNFDFLTKIKVLIPSINIDWLVTGEGDMYNSINSQELTTLKNELEELKAERRNLISSLGAMSQSFKSSAGSHLAKLKAVCKTAGFRQKLTIDELLMLNATPMYTVGLHS